MIFLNYLQHSPTSTFGSGLSTSARYEYEKYVGTLCHIHLIIEVDYAKLNWDQTNFVDDFIHATISEIVRSEDVQKMIVDAVFSKYRLIFWYAKRCFKVSPSYLWWNM